MTYFHWLAGAFLGLVWTWRMLDAAFGMSRVADISQPEWDCMPVEPPRVSVIVPARNEEADIEATLAHMLALDYPNREVIAVNDRSTDRTGEIIERVAAAAPAGTMKVIAIDELPAGWTGKTHAMWTAGNQATGEWLLFTDADVLFKPDVLRRALAYAVSECADHAVVLPRMIMKSWGERMMIAFFQTLFVFGHRPWKVADSKAKDHMGVGAFNLIRRPVYDALGTYRALRLEVLDDMKLGKVVKNGGYAQRNVFGGDLVSVRWAKGALGVVDNLTKNFFAVMSFRWPLAVAGGLTLAFMNLMPFAGILLAHGWARGGYALALFAIFCIYAGMSRRSDIPPYYFLLHPVSSTLFVYTMVRSTCLTLWRGGVVWRGTFYPLDELRKGMV